MAYTSLAVDKTSPVAWWSVLLTNAGVALSLLITLGGFFFTYWSITHKSGVAGEVFGLIIGFVFSRIFLRTLFNGGTIRKLRYTGTVEIRKGLTAWSINMPRRAFRSRKEAVNLAELLADELESFPLETTDEHNLVFVVGHTGLESPALQVKLFHKCEDEGKCEKPGLHLFGYNEKRDGEVFWPSI